MSVAGICDRCDTEGKRSTRGGLFREGDANLFGDGWTFHDGGVDLCPSCSKAFTVFVQMHPSAVGR